MAEYRRLFVNMVNTERWFLIYGVHVNDVTGQTVANQTVAGHTFSYEEAVAYAKRGMILATYLPPPDPIPTPPETTHKEPFYMSLPKYKKRKYRKEKI